MAKPSSYGTVARLCEMYLSQYEVYKATSRPPRMERTARIAAEGLDSLLVSMEKVIAPITFNQSLEAQAAKENQDNEQNKPPRLFG